MAGVLSFEFTTVALVWARWEQCYAIAATVTVFAMDVQMHRVFAEARASFDVPPLTPRCFRRCIAKLQGKSDVWGSRMRSYDKQMFDINYEAMDAIVDIESGTGTGFRRRAGAGGASQSRGEAKCLTPSTCAGTAAGTEAQSTI
jgi:hypothetical protein